ncbi:hypothetical protein GCM10010435_67580 [Winogradskya consettensis]|uniref:Integral membrane bound transporter domain-containing protein n=1 Tax=Winogradskya consettensis TaxID=113560 RepID=A0A919SJB5_9ACTN|nr:FUSC family protein [Actinoplanes consettensis]GIM73800.1 hypothetical protein Aco04nite_37190 [Actinoplanes consettensis]
MSRLRDAARVRPADAAWAFALRAGLAVAIPLVVLIPAGHTAWAGIATFGSFAALYARDTHYRSRGRVVAAAGLGLVTAVTIGTLAALTPAPAIPAVVAVSLVGAAATWLCGVFRVGPPAGLMFAFATAVSAAVPATPADLARHAVLTAAAALIAWLIAMAGAAFDRDAPRRLAVARALRAAAAAAEAPSGPPGLRLRHQAATAIEKAWTALPASPTPAALHKGPPAGSAGPAAGSGGPAAGSGGPAEPLSAGGGLDALVARAESALADPASANPADLRRLAGAAAKRGPVPALSPTKAESEEISGRTRAAALAPPPGRDLLRHSVRSTPLGGPLLLAALRVAVGALAAGSVAGALAHITGLGHAYWAAVSAVAVLQSTNLLVTIHRGIQRAAGTVAGLLVAVAVLAVPGGTWPLVALIVAAQITAELLVIRNYALAMLAVTPLALLVGELGHATPPLDLLRDRLIQTILGCAIGLLTAATIRTRTAARHLDKALATCTRTTDELTAAPTRELARRLAVNLMVLREAYEIASGEPALPPETTELVLATERRARSALATVT